MKTKSARGASSLLSRFSCVVRWRAVGRYCLPSVRKTALAALWPAAPITEPACATAAATVSSRRLLLSSAAAHRMGAGRTREETVDLLATRHAVGKEKAVRHVVNVAAERKRNRVRVRRHARRNRSTIDDGASQPAAHRPRNAQIALDLLRVQRKCCEFKSDSLARDHSCVALRCYSTVNHQVACSGRKAVANRQQVLAPLCFFLLPRAVLQLVRDPLAHRHRHTETINQNRM